MARISEPSLSVEVRAPGRLHFGLLALEPQDGRQFGGAGLMIRRPDVLIRISACSQMTATGRLADRALVFARRFMDNAAAEGLLTPLPGLSIHVIRAPRPHTGLGSGTQLALAIARGVAALARRPDLAPVDLARLVERGRRSAVGAWGFHHGGFIVEGGKPEPDALSPLLIQLPFPDDWRIVLIRPAALEGLSGHRESHAFRHHVAMPQTISAELCRLVLLGLAPAVIERHLEHFSHALYEMQVKVGQAFADAQGGLWTDASLDPVVQFIRDQGVPGVGQSSWGPTLYAVTADDDHAADLVQRLRRRFDFQDRELMITAADNAGSSIRMEGSEYPLIAGADRR